MNKGEVFYADLSPSFGGELGGIRPVVILKNCESMITVIPLRYHTQASPEERVMFLCNDSSIPPLILSHQIRTIDARRLKERVGQVSPIGMEKIKTIVKLFL